MNLIQKEDTEKLFFLKIFYDQFDIFSYDGSGNRRYTKMDQFIRNKELEAIQGDQDGGNRDFLEQHKIKLNFDKNELFQFKFDFETSFSAELFYFCLIELKLNLDDIFEEFKNKIYSNEKRKKSVIVLVKGNIQNRLKKS